MNETETLAYKCIIHLILDRASSYKEACDGIDALASDFEEIAKEFFDSLNKFKQ